MNYGLIHHYFGSATGVLEQASRQVRDDYYEAESDAGSMPDFFSMRAHPGYVRALTHVALDVKLAAADDHFPIVSALLDRHRKRYGEPQHAIQRSSEELIQLTHTKERLNDRHCARR